MTYTKDNLPQEYLDGIVDAEGNNPKELSDADKEFYAKLLNEGEAWNENDFLAESYRSRRNGMLASSDWTQQPDIPEETRTKWQSYRQALRDLPTHENWPNLEQSDWPSQPS